MLPYIQKRRVCVHIRKKNPTRNSLTRIRTAVSRSCSTTIIDASCQAFIALFYVRGNLRKSPRDKHQTRSRLLTSVVVKFAKKYEKIIVK